MKILFSFIISGLIISFLASSCNSSEKDTRMSDSTIMSDPALIDTNVIQDTLILDSSVVL